MSVQEPRQFTPAQVLEAARRAEGEGRVEFALQLYRHLATNHPGSGEASAAQDALARLGNNQTAAPGGRRPGPLTPPPFEPPPFEPVLGGAIGSPMGNPLGNPFDYSRSPETGFGPGSASQGYGQPAARPPPAEVHHAQGLALELPYEVRDYRTARLIAVVMTWLGGLTTLVGLGLLPVTVVSPKTIAALPIIGKLVGGPATVAWMLVGGLATIVLGQLVRALLDQAIATRDMAALARVEAEARYGEPGRRPRRRRG